MYEYRYRRALVGIMGLAVSVIEEPFSCLFIVLQLSWRLSAHSLYVLCTSWTQVEELAIAEKSSASPQKTR